MNVPIARVHAGRWIPHGSRHNVSVLEALGLFSFRMNHGPGEPSEVEVGISSVDPGEPDIRGFGVIAQKNFVPINAEIRDYPDLAGTGQKLAGKVDRDGLGFARRNTEVLNYGTPAASRVLHL